MGKFSAARDIIPKWITTLPSTTKISVNSHCPTRKHKFLKVDVRGGSHRNRIACSIRISEFRKSSWRALSPAGCRTNWTAVSVLGTALPDHFPSSFWRLSDLQRAARWGRILCVPLLALADGTVFCRRGPCVRTECWDKTQTQAVVSFRFACFSAAELFLSHELIQGTRAYLTYYSYESRNVYLIIKFDKFSPKKFFVSFLGFL